MDKSLLYFGAITLAGYLITAFMKPHTAIEGWEATIDMFAQAAGWIIVSMLAAGLLSQFIDATSIVRLFGREAGIRGVVLGALVGLLGTGSRWAVYPLAAGMFAAEASPGAIFAFMTTWQLVSLPRLPAEVPFFGLRFTVLRAVVSLVIAIIGGLLVEWHESHA